MNSIDVPAAPHPKTPGTLKLAISTGTQLCRRMFSSRRELGWEIQSIEALVFMASGMVEVQKQEWHGNRVAQKHYKDA